jgi:hypothetical protein
LSIILQPSDVRCNTEAGNDDDDDDDDNDDDDDINNKQWKCYQMQPFLQGL